MKQSMQSPTDLQHPIVQWTAQRQDGLCQIPLGAAWFDIFPLHHVLTQNSLTLAIYPNQNLLKNHATRLKLMGYTDRDFEFLSSDIPPHAERALWERMAKGEARLILMTARKLQSVQSLSQLIRHPNLGPILIQQAHLVMPHLWGPTPNPYTGLCNFFQDQWQNHPALILFANPLPKGDLSQMASLFALKQPLSYQTALPLQNSQLRVSKHITQHQKLRALKDWIGAPHAKSPCKTWVICHSVKAIGLLQTALKSLHPVVVHHQLDYQTRENRLLTVLQKDEPIALIESTLLAELPSHALSSAEYHIIHWQMPWSIEALLQSMLPAVQEEATQVQTTVLYSKEDFSIQKKWLKSYFSQNPAFHAAAVNHLTRLRLYLKATDTCRHLQLESFLGNGTPGFKPCKHCEICLNKVHSSRWMNLIDTFLY